jgi:hypothetical protein
LQIGLNRLAGALGQIHQPVPLAFPLADDQPFPRKIQVLEVQGHTLPRAQAAVQHQQQAGRSQTLAEIRLAGFGLQESLQGLALGFAQMTGQALRAGQIAQAKHAVVEGLLPVGQLAGDPQQVIRAAVDGSGGVAFGLLVGLVSPQVLQAQLAGMGERPHSQEPGP